MRWLPESMRQKQSVSKGICNQCSKGWKHQKGNIMARTCNSGTGRERRQRPTRSKCSKFLSASTQAWRHNMSWLKARESAGNGSASQLHEKRKKGEGGHQRAKMDMFSPSNRKWTKSTTRPANKITKATKTRNLTT